MRCFGRLSSIPFLSSDPWNMEIYGIKILIHHVLMCLDGPFSSLGLNWQSNGLFHRHQDVIIWVRAQICAVLASVKNVPGSFAFSPQFLSLILLGANCTELQQSMFSLFFFWWWPNLLLNWEWKDPDCYGKHHTTRPSCNDSSQACPFLPSLLRTETSSYQKGLGMFSI